jgi:signal transduction histidine kinase
MRLALKRQPGAMLAPNPAGTGKALVGYAFASIPGWAVLTVQPSGAALAATNYLARRMSLLVIPILTLIAAGGWALASLYQRQEKMAQLLAEQNERLRAADHAKSDFLANVSHDLRTPLASMQLLISAYLDATIAWDTEQIRGCLRLTSAEIDNLTARVRNLLEIARIEEDALALYKEPSDLTDIVGAALERLKPMTCDRHIEVDFPPVPLLVECDQAQIETVLLNLLENALKYSPPETPLCLRGESRAGSVFFTVRDQGPGLKPSDEARVFERFYRAPTGRSARGTGLGLPICKAIIEAHGGAIGVQSAPGGGAEFWFSLPALPPLEEASR